MKILNKYSIVLIVCMLVLVTLSYQPAQGQTNLCVELLRPITLPVEDCGWGLECLFLPQCCTPGACFMFPECESLQILKKTIKAGEIYCDFSPEEYVEQLLAKNIASGADLLAAGLPTPVLVAFDALVDTVALGGSSFPAATKQVLKDLIAPYYDYGRTGYSYEDVDNVKIISDKDPVAALFLGEGFGAVALGPVIVIRDDAFKQLHADFSLEDIQKGYTTEDYNRAIELAVHELVHVAQHRRNGYDVFRTNYVLDTYLKGGGDEGYQRSVFEDEAYGFSATLSLNHGGWYCEDTRDKHEDVINRRNLGIPYGACEPLYYGNVPVDKCLLPVKWVNNTTIPPLPPTKGPYGCVIAQLPYPYTGRYAPLVIRPNYYVKAHTTKRRGDIEDCEMDFSNPAEPLWKCPEKITYSCDFGALQKDKCYLGTAPDGTHADMAGIFFVYSEIPLPTPTPTRAPTPTRCPPESGTSGCPSGSHCLEPGMCRCLQCSRRGSDR